MDSENTDVSSAPGAVMGVFKGADRALLRRLRFSRPPSNWRHLEVLGASWDQIRSHVEEVSSWKWHPT